MTAIRIRTIGIAALVAFALPATGCGSDEPAPSAAKRIPGAIQPGDPVPLPDGKPVLRVRGVTGGNQGATTSLDLATLERLPGVEVAIDEPFERRSMTFRGVPLAALLEIAGAGSDRSSVLVHALDDYHVEFSMQDLADSGAVLATRADGRRIALEDGGPIRVVFPGSGGPGKNRDNWIWSVDWIRVEA